MSLSFWLVLQHEQHGFSILRSKSTNESGKINDFIFPLHPRGYDDAAAGRFLISISICKNAHKIVYCKYDLKKQAEYVPFVRIELYVLHVVGIFLSFNFGWQYTLYIRARFSAVMH